MSDTTFVAGTVVTKEWLNDVNDATYNGTAVFTPAGTGAVTTTVQAKLREDILSSDYATLQQAVTAAAGKSLRVVGSYTITAAVTVLSNTTIIIEGGATVTTTTADISIFSATGKTGITISGPGSITKTVNNGTTAYVGGVVFTNCTNCHVLGVTFTGMQWAGVYMLNSSNCSVRGCYMSGWLGTIQDAADVSISSTSLNNVVDGNWLYGGGEHGVLIQDPYSDLIPLNNIVSNNRIGQHTGYGVIIYMPGPTGTGDSFNQVIGNYIENIQGSFASNRSSGTGIYVVGAWAGGTQIIGNTVKNCCVQTLDRTLSPAGIGINGIPASVAKPVVANNTVTSITQGDGILVTSSPGGAEISGNVINLPASNNGTGVGGATLVGGGVRIEASNDVTVTGGNVIIAGTGSALLVYANGVNSLNPTIVGGAYSTSGTAPAIRTLQVGGFTVNNFSISGSKIKVSNPAAFAMQLATISGGVVSGVTATAGGGAGSTLDISACTLLRVSGGSFTGSAAANLSTVGTCTGGFVDKATYLGASTGFIVNSATGMAIDWRSSAAPASGTWAVGDAVQQSVPVVGNPKGWRCTVAGTPGTWVSEGNL